MSSAKTTDVRALVFDGSLALRELDVPEPGPGQALVRVELAGVCNTDVEITRGYMGHRGVLGHELVGTVVRCDDPALLGARVAAEINLACGHCEWCARGLGRHCPTRTVMGILGHPGCFAEYVALPIANLHRIPDGIADVRAVFVEPLAAAFEILEQVPIACDTPVLVIGDGKLGLLAALVLADHGARVSIAGRHPRKLAVAASRGVTVLDTIAPRSFAIVVEATGAPSGLDTALRAIMPRGTLVLKSTFHGTSQLALAPVVVDEITIVGSRCGPFTPAIAALHAGTIDPTPLVDRTFALQDAAAAIAHAQQPGVLKVLIDCR